MATIHDLPIQSITEMTEAELQQHILAVRQRRRNPDPEMKAHAKKKAIKKKNEASALKSIDSMLANITPEQAAQMLEALKEGVKK